MNWQKSNFQFTKMQKNDFTWSYVPWHHGFHDIALSDVKVKQMISHVPRYPSNAEFNTRPKSNVLAGKFQKMCPHESM